MSDANAPEPFLEQYLLFLLARASQVASGQFHAELARRGVPVLTWRVLAVLSDGPASVGDLSRAVVQKQTTLSKALDRYEAEGLIARTRTDRDRRKVTVSLLPRGRSLAAELIPLAQRHQEDLLARYTPEDRAALIRILRDFVDAAEREDR